MMLTDTHAHLYAEQFDADRDQMIACAAEKNVGRLFLPNIDVSSIQPLMKLVAEYPHVCFPMMGLHPCSVDQDFQHQLKQIEETLRTHSFCAIGEIGIDLY